MRVTASAAISAAIENLAENPLGSRTISDPGIVSSFAPACRFVGILSRKEVLGDSGFAKLA